MALPYKTDTLRSFMHKGLDDKLLYPYLKESVQDLKAEYICTAQQGQLKVDDTSFQVF